MKIFSQLFLSVCILFTGVSMAQKSKSGANVEKSNKSITIEWGLEYKNDKKEAIQKIIHDDGNNIYANVIKSDPKPVVGIIGQKIKVTPVLIKFDQKNESFKTS